MTTTTPDIPSVPRVLHVTVNVGTDPDLVKVTPQDPSTDEPILGGATTAGPRVYVFAKLEGATLQLAGSPDALRSFGQAIIDGATTIEQRQLARGVVVGF